MTTQLWWYVARAGGLLAWALLAGSVLWGVALSSRIFGRRPRPAWLLDLHRYLGGLAVIFVGVHVVAILLDTYVTFRLTDVLVPFAGTWHPAAVAWGIVAMYLLLAVELTSLARPRLPPRVWRWVHYASFPLFVLATVHALTAGTDRTNPAAPIGMLSVCAVVALLTLLRAQPDRGGSSPAQPPRPRPDPQPRVTGDAGPVARPPASPRRVPRTPVSVTLGPAPGARGRGATRPRPLSRSPGPRVGRSRRSRRARTSRLRCRPWPGPAGQVRCASSGSSSARSPTPTTGSARPTPRRSSTR